MNTLLDLKEHLGSMDERQLKQPIVVMNSDKTISTCGEIKILKEDLLNDGSDDPCVLQTSKQFLEDGYSEEEIDEFDVEFSKNDLIIVFED
ncbi:MAG: hypothetical protein N4A72_22080 [Bacteroidales bacterium]|jgi:hypothetical protein|nr:hypothetical protein [Bacteroidales bacterium]